MNTPSSVLRSLGERDGHRSAWTGNDDETLVPQHRHGGMGGRKNKHRLSNVVWLESVINGLIESDPEWQMEALRRGIKISGFADPLTAPIKHAVHGIVLLDDLGGYVPSSAADTTEWHIGGGAGVVQS